MVSWTLAGGRRGACVHAGGKFVNLSVASTSAS
jgi:hypothetical protein